MAGVNKDRRGESKKQSHKKHSNDSKVDVDENSPVIKLFRGFQTELDARHDKYERLVKISRDITIESKRAIFLLHRYRDCGSTSDGSGPAPGTEGGTPVPREEDEILRDAKQKLKDIQATKFKIIAQELTLEDPNQFMRAISPGLQEYVEGLSFYYYLQYGRLVTLQEVNNDLIFVTTDDESHGNQTIRLEVPPVEYLLGIADLSGELMRLAINHVGAGNLDLPYKVCGFLQMMHYSFNSYGGTIKDLKKKMGTLRQSLRKVENACYTLHVRGSEIPKHMLADVLLQSADEFVNDGE